MRILFTSLPLSGHVNPLVPLAAGLRDAGHEVAFATGPALCPTVAALGFPVHAVGVDPVGDAQRDALFPEARGLTGLALEFFIQEEVRFRVIARSRLPDLLALGAAWRPDLVVRENADWAGYVAAEALGVAHAMVQAGSFNPPRLWRHEILVARLDGLRAAAGLPPDPDFAAPFRYLHLHLLPRCFHDPAVPLPPTAHFVRPATFDRTGDEALPDWVAALPERPTVYATLGTIFNKRADLFAAILAALGGEPINLIMTVGRDQDPAQFGPQSGNVRVARYIPQSLLLPRCDVAVLHGGLNSIRGALECGLPLVVLPIRADQPQNADRCAALGVGKVIPAETATPELLRAAVRGVLGDPAYRERAEWVRQEMLATPGPEHAVALLERLARDRIPIAGE